VSDPTVQSVDVLVIGGGPAGVKAALTAARAGRITMLVEKGGIGGECVHRGTIPSKTMHETAQNLASLRQRSGLGRLGPRTTIESLTGRLEEVRSRYAASIDDELAVNGVALRRGRARFLSAHEVAVTGLDGSRSTVRAGTLVIATGSRPRNPPELPVDHEFVLDSDSILSLIYLPESLAVIGAGVIACEFASVFQTLGVAVTIVDRGPRPLAFLDPELTAGFLGAFERAGGTFHGAVRPTRVQPDGMGGVVTELETGQSVRTEKVLVAQGRTASVAGLGIEAAGLAATERGFVRVDEHYRTAQPHIYAVGDVIGPPALAASSMNQGRRAVCHALSLELGAEAHEIPAGIYTLPELAFVGLTEEAVRQRCGSARVGRASLSEVARGQINGVSDGLLKLVADPGGRRLLGVHACGAGAIELVHLGQMAMAGGLPVDTFVDQVFNFPTYAEAYRVAALELIEQRGRVAVGDAA